jgi:cytoskeletal protein RodZ
MGKEKFAGILNIIIVLAFFIFLGNLVYSSKNNPNPTNSPVTVQENSIQADNENEEESSSATFIKRTNENDIATTKSNESILKDSKRIQDKSDEKDLKDKDILENSKRITVRSPVN